MQHVDMSPVTAAERCREMAGNAYRKAANSVGPIREAHQFVAEFCEGLAVRLEESDGTAHARHLATTPLS